jgi:hypothetical protein
VPKLADRTFCLFVVNTQDWVRHAQLDSRWTAFVDSSTAPAIQSIVFLLDYLNPMARDKQISLMERNPSFKSFCFMPRHLIILNKRSVSFNEIVCAMVNANTFPCRRSKQINFDCGIKNMLRDIIFLQQFIYLCWWLIWTWEGWICVVNGIW